MASMLRSHRTADSPQLDAGQEGGIPGRDAEGSMSQEFATKYQLAVVAGNSACGLMGVLKAKAQKGRAFLRKLLRGRGHGYHVLMVMG